jgi:hypothetical protein
MLRKKQTLIGIIPIIFIATVAYTAQVCITFNKDFTSKDLTALSDYWGYQNEIFLFNGDIEPNPETRLQYVKRLWKIHLIQSIKAARKQKAVRELNSGLTTNLDLNIDY